MQLIEKTWGQRGGANKRTVMSTRDKVDGWLFGRLGGWVLGWVHRSGAGAVTGWDALGQFHRCGIQCRVPTSSASFPCAGGRVILGRLVHPRRGRVCHDAVLRQAGECSLLCRAVLRMCCAEDVLAMCFWCHSFGCLPYWIPAHSAPHASNCPFFATSPRFRRWPTPSSTGCPTTSPQPRSAAAPSRPR